jgi:UDP-N-acetylmuramoyl-tripeptide--D-alanyl-D-alanine ligase
MTAMMASACVTQLGIDLQMSASCLRSLERTQGRLHLLHASGGIRVIDDAYNASPDSMRAALDWMTSLAADRRIAVLAGMNELGGQSRALHRAVGAHAAEVGVDLLVTVGDRAKDIAEGYKGTGEGNGNSTDNDAGSEAGVCDRTSRTARECRAFGTNAEASAWLMQNTRPGDIVLVKGSRAWKMEQIVATLIGTGTER